MDTVSLSEPDLLQRYQALLKDRGGMRARNAAAVLGVSEGELLARRVGLDVLRLRCEPKEILQAVTSLGEVMALTRNDACVHERMGVYGNFSFAGHVALAVNPDIDLRMFLSHWSSAFAVEENGRQSLQFFDHTGEAAHKIYLTEASNQEAYQALLARFTAIEQQDWIEPIAAVPEPAARPDSEIDVAGLEAAWRGLKDTHDFHALLKRFDVRREQAMRLVADDLATSVANDAPRRILEAARDSGCEIMVFVGNRACIQIHTGPVHTLKAIPGWFNVLDERFNLHLNEEAIASCWLSRKPTVDGVVTALEVFDTQGRLIVTFFGKRKPGVPELPLWRELTQTLLDR